MNYKKYANIIRRRVKKGENIDSVIEELNNTLSKKDLNIVLDIIADEDSSKLVHKKKKDGHLSQYIKILIFLLVFSAAVVAYLIYSGKIILDPNVRNFDPALISDPVQTPYQGDPILLQTDNSKIRLIPIATFNLSVMIGSIQEYDDSNIISPMDVVVMWGEIAKPDYSNNFKITQTKRNVFYKTYLNSRWSLYYISLHSANIHAIPATDNVMDGLLQMRKKQIVNMYGYLVNVEYDNGGENRYWKTSQSRSDSGPGSGEIMYITRISSGTNVFE